MKSRKLLFIILIVFLALLFSIWMNIVCYASCEVTINGSVISYGYVSVSSSLNLHEEPDSNSIVLESLYDGTIVEVIGKEENGFYYVDDTQNGIKGYVASSYVVIPDKNNGYEIASIATCSAVPSDGRDKNMAEAARRINENRSVLYQGETFNWFDVVGNASIANGFYPAPVLENGVSVQGEGGGVCQVSTTIYQAVSKLGIDIIERHQHTSRVSYTEPGTDATVSYDGGLNFIFQNNLDYPIYIEIETGDGRVTVRVYKVIDEQKFSKYLSKE